MKSLVRLLLAGLGMLIALFLILPLLALALPFWIVAGITRGTLAAIRTRDPDPRPWQELIRYEPEVGWRPWPDLDVYTESDRVFHLTTDAEGWRGEGSLDDAEVIALGDSFAFGSGVDDPEFFAHQDVGRRIKAVGANGYSMVHGLLWLRRLQPRLEGKLVTWMIYYGNDLYENLMPNLGPYRMPFVRETDDGSWEVVTSHVESRSWDFARDRNYYDRLAEICCDGELADRAFSACDFLVGQARKAVESAGAELCVLGIPDPKQLDPDEARTLAGRVQDPSEFDVSLPDRRLAQVCSAHSVPFVTLRDHLRRADYKDRDCHWNPRGHREVARLLAELRTSDLGEPVETGSPFSEVPETGS